MEEGLFPSHDHPIRLPIFEGPLDLLLFLIRKNEVDIYDIPIAEVTNQYLAVLEQMETLNLEIAGDFFVMAATLMYIKSRMLLPKKDQGPELQEEEEDEDIDPRWELIQQLLEYRRVKEASATLQELIENAHDLIPRKHDGDSAALEPRPLQPVDRIALWNTFNQVLRRLTERMIVGEIHDEVITVSEQMEVILNRLHRGGRFSFTSLFPERPSLPLVVASFLAVLELARLNQISIEQDENFSEIYCQVPEPRDSEKSSDQAGSQMPIQLD